jgi:hypothetical protein
MQQTIWRAAAFTATIVLAVMAYSAAEARSGGGQPGSAGAQTSTTASKTQSKSTIKFSPEYTRYKSGTSKLPPQPK